MVTAEAPRDPRVFIALDIDQTLAGGVVPAHMQHYNRYLELSMTQERIQACETYPKTFDVPELARFQEKGTPENARFEEVRAMIRTSSEVHLALTPIESSINGSRRLVTEGAEFAGYYTFRPSELRDCTPQWLKEKGFHNPGKVVMCTATRDKWPLLIKHYLAGDGLDNSTQVVLVDDSVKELTQYAGEIALEEESREALRCLTLVGFGRNAAEFVAKEGEGFERQTNMRLLALPSWSDGDVDRLQEQLLRPIPAEV